MFISYVYISVHIICSYHNKCGEYDCNVVVYRDGLVCHFSYPLLSFLTPYHILVVSYQKSIESCTRTLIRHREDWAPRYSEFPKSIYLMPIKDGCESIFTPDPGFGRGCTFLYYDDKLYSRYEMLFKAMGGSRCWEELRVTSIQLPKVLLDLLAKTMLETREYRTHYYIMRFESNQFGIEELQHLPEVLDAIVHHAHLYFYDNVFDSIEAADSFASAIRSCKKLNDVHIRCCGIGKDLKILRSILHGCSNVNLLRIDLNNLRSDGAAIVCEFIASDPCIKHLLLGPEYTSIIVSDNKDIQGMYSDVDESERNKFDDADAVLFSNALRNNTNLQLLTLPNTCFEPSDLDEAFFDSSSLNAAYTSNHTCRIVNNKGVQPIIAKPRKARGKNEHGW